MHQSGGGVTGDGAQSYAATVISAAKVLPSIVVPVVSFIFVFGLDLEYVYICTEHYAHKNEFACRFRIEILAIDNLMCIKTCSCICLQSVSKGLSLIFSQTVASSLTGSKPPATSKRDVTALEKTGDYKPGVVTVLDVQGVRVEQHRVSEVSG